MLSLTKNVFFTAFQDPMYSLAICGKLRGSSLLCSSSASSMIVLRPKLARLMLSVRRRAVALFLLSSALLRLPPGASVLLMCPLLQQETFNDILEENIT
jgi:hypothetical protein